MKRPSPHIFVGRDVYRRRRLMDAARLLPVLGVLLFLVPVLWAPQTTPEADTARGGLYVFVVWAGLIGAAYLLSRRLGRSQEDGAGKGGEGG